MIRGIIFALLHRQPGTSERCVILQNALARTKGVYLPAFVIGRLKVKDSKNAEEPSSLLGEEDELSSLRGAAVQVIRTAAADGRLKDETHLGSTLFFWKEWGGGEEVRDWVTQLILSREGLFKFLSALLGWSEAGDYERKRKWFLYPQNIEELIGLSTVRAAYERYKDTPLTEDEKRAAKAFEEAIQRHERGDPSTPSAIYFDE